MAFWRNIGRFGHTSCNYKREKVFWGKWFFNEGLAVCTWVNTRQPAHGVTTKYPTSSRALQAAWEKLLARRSHRVNFVQINTGILACSREGGCDRPKDNKSTNVQVSNTKNVFKGACGVCTKGENSISPKEQEMTRRQSNQKKCIGDQKWWSQSTFFDLQKNPYLPHNLKALDKGHVSHFFFLFECKHLKDAVSLWTGRLCTYKRKPFFPKHHKKIHTVSFPQQFQKNFSVHSLKTKGNTAAIHEPRGYLQNKLLRSFHGQSLGDLWRAFLDLLWRRALQFRGPSGCPLGWLMASCWAVSRPTIWV